MTFEKIIKNYQTSQYYELKKWIDQWVLDWTIQTICDVRRNIESVFWVWKYSNDEIIEWIINAWWTFTNRPESDTWDYCYVELDKLYEIIWKNFWL